MEIPAQPLSFGQILDRTFRLSRANLMNFIFISLVPASGLLVTALAMVGTMFYYLRPDRGLPQSLTPPEIVLISAASLAAIIVMMFVFALFQPAICHAALEADRGIEAGFSAAYAKAWSRCGRYLWLMLLKSVIVAGPMYGAILAIAGLMFFELRSGGNQSGFLLVVMPLLMLIYFAGSVYAAFAMIRLALATPACVAEDLPAWAAIRRSLQLTRGAMGRIFLIGLIIYAINYAAVIVFEVVAGLIVALGALLFSLMNLGKTAEITVASFFGVLLFAGFMVLTGALWASFSVAFSLVYLDQKVRIDPRHAAGPQPEGAA